MMYHGPLPPFGKEKTLRDHVLRVAWECWAESVAREAGHNALADGHALARQAYLDQIGRVFT